MKLMTLTRDSALWWLGVAAGVVGYLEHVPPPWAWSYEQWMAALSVAIIGLSLKLQTSPLAHSDDAKTPSVDVSKLAPIVLIALALSGCMGTARHRATVTVVSAHAVLSAVQDGEAVLVCGRPTAPPAPRCVSAETHREVSAKLVTAFDIDGKVLQLVRALPANASSSDVATMLGQIGAIIDAVFKLIPESSERQTLAAKVGAR